MLMLFANWRDLHTGPWLAKTYDVSLTVAARWNVVAMLANGMGCLLVGALLNRGIKALTLGIVGIVLTGLPALVIFSLQPGLMPSIFASWVFTFGSGLLVGMWALAPVVAPSRDSMGATSGLITQLTLIGVFLGPHCSSMPCIPAPVMPCRGWCWQGLPCALPGYLSGLWTLTAALLRNGQSLIQRQ
ncbi:hypothetical protein ABC733_02760 [Mangrovibacter sp. SLW1]